MFSRLRVARLIRRLCFKPPTRFVGIVNFEFIILNFELSERVDSFSSSTPIYPRKKPEI
ncbi:hypothetical protein NIES4073_45510 [Kalymmatonema gypsitolerans NIES-4073]|nr:hypothetical protein NIES4073_45510 [Scytonema sp. NIES-4073]